MSERNAKIKGLVWLLAALGLAATAAFGFSSIVRWIPYSVEEKIAASLPLISEARACGRRGGTAALALQKLVERLFPLAPVEARHPLRVDVVRDKEINAFASLGGRILINQGLLEQASSPEELAGVLAHEIEHVQRRHVLEGVIVKLGTLGAIQLLVADPSATEMIGLILGLQYGKTQEREADEGGLARLARAEIDVNGLREFFERMARKGTRLDFLSDHPSDTDRASRVRAYEGRPARPILNTEEWKALRGICES